MEVEPSTIRALALLLVIFMAIPGVNAVDYVGGWSKCSCGINEGAGWHKHYWINECPYCHHSSLVYSVQKYSGYCEVTGRYEGLHPESHIFCLHCDADFCGFCGKSHTYSNSYYLTRYYPEKVNTTNNTNITKPTPPKKEVLFKFWIITIYK